jgi:hypothetical protein
MEQKLATLEAPVIGVLNYGFSMPSKINTTNEYCSDKDVSMVNYKGKLYLAYKVKNINYINILVGTVDKNDIKWSEPKRVVSTIPGVVCHTEDYPTLTIYKDRIVLFWRQPDYKNIDYGFLNLTSLELDSVGFIPDKIESKKNVAAVNGEYNTYFTFWHLGKESDKIYQSIFVKEAWADEYIDQSSKYPPEIVVDPINPAHLHLIHRGKDRATIYYSKNTNGLPASWTEDKEIITAGGNKIKTDQRPGLGVWKSQYLVAVYRDDDFIEKGFRLAFMDVKTGIWQGDDYVCMEVVNSDHAPALAPYQGELNKQFICMAYASRSNSGAIEVTVSKEIVK